MKPEALDCLSDRGREGSNAAIVAGNSPQIQECWGGSIANIPTLVLCRVAVCMIAQVTEFCLCKTIKST